MLIIIFSLAVGIAPLISVLLSSFIAEIGGCTLHEGFVQPCEIGSFNLGSTLYTMFVAGWLMLLSIPLGIMGLIVGFILLIAQK